MIFDDIQNVDTCLDGFCELTRLELGSVRLFVHSETGSRIFAGCQLLTSRRVDDWVSTYHSWEQSRCPHDFLQLKGSGIHAPARPVTPHCLVQRQRRILFTVTMVKTRYFINNNNS